MRLLKFQVLVSPTGSLNEPSELFYASLVSDSCGFVFFFPLQFSELHRNASPSAYKQGFSMGESLARWQTLLFSSILKQITHLAKIMGSWGAVFVSQTAPRVTGAGLPALGSPRLQRQDTCILGSHKSCYTGSHVDTYV